MTTCERIGLPKRIIDPGNEPFCKSINKYSVETKVKLVEEYLGEDLFKTLKKTFLGPVITVATQAGMEFSRNIFHYLLARRLEVKNRKELWFCFNEQPMRFGEEEFSLVTGLKLTGSLEKPKKRKRTENSDPWVQKKGYTLDDLLAILKDEEDDLTNDQKIRLGALIIVEAVLIARNPTSIIAVESLSRAENFQYYCDLPWGKIAYNVLLEEINTTSVEKLGKPQIGMKGYIRAIHIWALCSVDVLRERFATEEISDATPLCLRFKTTASPEIPELLQQEKKVSPFLLRFIR